MITAGRHSRDPPPPTHSIDLSRPSNTYAGQFGVLSGTIATNQIMANLSLLSTSAKAVVNHGDIASFINTLDGSFQLTHLPPGSHVLTIVDANYEFPRIRMDVIPSLTLGKPVKVRCSLTQPGMDWSTAVDSVPYMSAENNRVEVAAVAKRDFFKKRDSFSILSLLMNPMILISGFTMILFLVLPKLTEGIDPEEMREIQKQQREALQGSNPLANMDELSGKLANYFSGPSAAAAPGSSSRGGSAEDSS